MLKNVKKYKSAMTMAELLVVFVIMGIIATLTMVTAKPGEKSLKYIYHRMYHSIDIALYNSSLSMSDALRQEIYETNNTVAILPGGDKQFPSKPSQLCKMLIEYINTKGSDNCAAADESPINVNNPDFSIEPHFIASNGTKVWMGTQKASITDGKAYDSNTLNYWNTESNSLGLYQTRVAYVFVDLNGEMGPNTPIQKGNNLADIVGFAITPALEAIPIGPPITDTRYFSARVVYANKAAKDSDNLITSQPMSFLQAKKLAWGLDNKDDINKWTTDLPLTLNNWGVTCNSPFYVGYTKNGGASYCNSIPNGINLDNNYDEITNQVVDEDCKKTNDDGSSTIDMDACYLEIKDYY